MAERPEGVEEEVGRRRKLDPPRGVGYFVGMTSVTQPQPLGNFPASLFQTFHQTVAMFILVCPPSRAYAGNCGVFV